MHIRFFSIAVAMLGLVPGLLRAQEFPFTRAENVDGARFVWFSYSRAGFPYQYTRAETFPDHPGFRAVTDPQVGDVVWWPEYMAVFADSNRVVTAEGSVLLQQLAERFGTPQYFRHRIPKGQEGPGLAVNPFRLIAGRVEFAAPVGWRILNQMQQDTIGMAVFHVPNAWTDSASSDRTNVLVIVRQRGDDQSLQSFSDSLFANMIGDQQPVVVLDGSEGPATRIITWRGNLRGTPYLISDRFAVANGVYLNLRVSRPTVDIIPESWIQTFAEELERLLVGLTVDGDPVFLEMVREP